MRRWTYTASIGGLLAVGGVWAAEQAKPPSMKDVPKDMRTYYVAFLVAGPKFAPGSPDHATLMPKHLAFIRKMISEKKLLLAGPFTDEGRIFGIAVVAAASAGEAKAWMEQDPAVQAGFFDHEIHQAMLPSLDSLRIRY
ncbi:MAG: YciI family protein [Myxococcaceae bacterium]